MREISFEEGKKVELDILVDIAKFCDERGLRYYLAYGTLIGAIRHNGFIPWDDDIDIMMPRADYDEFLRTYNTGNKIYRVISPRDKIARHSFAKVIDTRTVKIEPMVKYKEFLGVDVDIFPLDGMPDDDDTYKIWYETLYTLYKKVTVKGLKRSYYPRLTTRLKLLAKQIAYPSRDKLLNQAQALHKQYPYESSALVGSLECEYCWVGGRSPKECYDDSVMVDFEGLQFRAPIGYDRILRDIYGDYMQLPPEEKRVTHHTNKMYWKE